MAVWLVRAGRRGEQQNFALANNVVVIGWSECPDLSQFESREAAAKMYRSLHPDFTSARISMQVGQFWAFAKRIQVGDIVALPLKDQDAVAFGKVAGDYQYREENPLGARHLRPVEWITQDMPRQSIDQDILYSLGAQMTVCRVRRNNAEERIRALLNGRPAPRSPSPAGDDEEDDLADVSVAPDIEESAATQIRDYLTRHFAGHRMAGLIEALLRVQGYHTIKSDEGPDGGVDIIAGRGPLGFDPPRLCVQVKATGSPQDIKVIRELKGVMTDFSAEQGLFVSWGGFKRSVLSEARRHFFEIRLWDASDVIREIQLHYDQLPDAVKAELPLKRVWTLATEDSQT